MLPAFSISQAIPRGIILMGIILINGCATLFPQECSVNLDNAVTIPYSLTVADTTTEATAIIAALRDSREDEILIRFKGSGANGIESLITIDGSPAAGTPLAYDHTATYPPDYIFEVQFDGTGISGEGGGLQSGSVTISRLTDSSISGVLAFSHHQAQTDAAHISTDFTDIPVQPCA